MNKVLRIIIVGILAMVGSTAFAATLPVVTPTSATVPWSLPSNCTAATTCQFQIYRCTGTCTASDSTWTLIATTAAQATSYKDTTVTGGTQYTYDVEAVPTGSSTVFSGPSNTGLITTLFTPLPPVIGIVTTP